MLEATEGTGPHSGRRIPWAPERAGGGELGQRAAAKRLLLSHYSDELDAEALRARRRAGFGAPVEWPPKAPAT